MKRLVIRNFNTNEEIASMPTKKRKNASCIDDVHKLLNIERFFVQGKIDYRTGQNDLHYVAYGIEPFTFSIEEV